MATPSAEVASAALYGGGSDSRAAGVVTVVVATPSAEVASAALYGGGSDSRAAGVVTVVVSTPSAATTMPQHHYLLCGAHIIISQCLLLFALLLDQLWLTTAPH